MSVADLLGDDGFDPAALDTLGPANIAELASIASDPFGSSRAAALSLLGFVDPATALLTATQVFQEGAEPDLLGAALSAAAQSGELGYPIAAGLALDPDDLDALAAWSRLAQIAPSDELGNVETLAAQTSGVVYDVAQFTLSVMAYRAGRSGYEVATPGGTLGVDLDQPYSLIGGGPTSDEDFAMLSRLSSAERYRVDLRQDLVVTIDCGPRHMLLAVDAYFGGRVVDWLFESPSLAGFLATLNQAGTAYEVSELVLTWPADGGLLVTTHHPTGTQLRYGTASLEGDGAYAYLGTVDIPGAVPADLAFYIADAVELGEAVSADQAAEGSPAVEFELDDGD